MSDTPESAKQNLIQDWASAIKTSPLPENLILAYENAQVAELNKLARYHLNAMGALSNPAITRNTGGEIGIAIGERILFLENNWRYNVKNGQLGTITGYTYGADSAINTITVLLDGQQGKMVTFNPAKYKKFAHSYAVTIHRAQGTTVDNVFALASRGWNRHLSYVAMTRHRILAKLYNDKELNKSLPELKKNLAKIGTKDSTLDYPLAFAARRGVDIAENESRLQKHIFEKLKKIKVELKNGFEQTFRPKQYWAKQAQDVEKQHQVETLLTRREDAKRVAAYVDANCEAGKAGAELQSLGIENPTEEERAFLNNHSLSKAFSLAIAKRDEIASELYTEPERYSVALEIYGISLERLAKQSEAHQRRLRVLQYVDELNRGRIVHRDRLAFIIQSDIKAHYSALMAAGVALEVLKVQANAHERREVLRNSSLAEREAFREVESYLKLSREGGSLWHQIITKEKALKTSALILVNDLTAYQVSRLQALAKTGVPISREWLVKAAKITQQRDSLAASIIQNRSHYQKALDYYEFGSLKTSSEATSAYDIQASGYAKERLEKLEKQAKLFISKKADQQFVQDYVDSLNCQSKDRYAMAAKIHEDKARYYRIVYDISDSPNALFKFIWQDAKMHARNLFLEGPSHDEQERFLRVEQFVKANRTAANIWHETKAIPDPRPAILKEIAVPHIVSRDALANTIFNEAEHYKTALDYFKLKPEHLSQKAFNHQVREDLTAFKRCVGDLKSRMALARKLISNRSAYVVIKEESLVNWQQLQRYADYARKIEYISNFTAGEKTDYSSVIKYKHLRFEAGKSWSYIFSQKKAGKVVARDLFNKAIAINRERNALAFTIKNERDRFDDFLFFNQVQTKDIDKHAEAHAESLKAQKAAISLQANQSQGRTAGFLMPSIKNSADSYGNTNIATSSFEKNVEPYWDANTVSEALIFNASAFVESLLGHPNQRLSDSRRLRYGNKGSLSVNISGHYVGTWKDFESREKGNFIQLIQRKLQMDFKEALQFAAEWAGVAPETDLLKKNQKTERQCYLKPNSFTPEQLKSIKDIKKIVSRSFPIAGTIAESYLRTHRGITGPILDKSFRFNHSVWECETQKNWPALVVIARDAKEEVQAVQCIYLDPKTHNKLDIEVQKRSFGPQKGVSVLVQAAKFVPNVGYQYALSEGPETALSVAAADPNLGVFVTLGVSNFANAPIPFNAKNVLLCGDNDGIEASSNKSLNTAIHTLSERGLDVYLVKPSNCKDFNDVLKNHGAEEVKRIMETKTLVKEALTLQQLKENKVSIVSDVAKIIIEFSEKYTDLQKYKDPQTLEEFELKAQLSQRSGELALHIKNDSLLMEAAERHGIKNQIHLENSRHIAYQEKQKEAQILLKELNSKDLIADYMEATQRKANIAPPWVNKIEAEKVEWRALNNRVRKLAFIIDNDPTLCYEAKNLNIGKAVSSEALTYQRGKSQDREMSMDMGIDL